MRRLITLGFSLAVFVSSPFWARAAIIRGPAATIYTRSILHRDTLYIPLAALARAYGLNLIQQEGPFLILSSEQCRLEIEPGSREARINGEVVRMSAPPDWVGGTLMVPIYLAIQKLSARFPPTDMPFAPIPKTSLRIVIDPGHGGLDPGAVGAEGIKEKDVVLKIASRVKPLLEIKGYEVLMTRSGDTFLPLRKRAQLANRSRADVFVSIHANSAFNHLAQGTETFYYARASDFSARKLALRENAVLKLEAERENAEGEINRLEGEGVRPPSRLVNSVQLAGMVQRRLAEITSGPDRGVKTAEFHVLRYTRMPSILVETGFLSHRDEGNLLSTIRYRERLAGAIARGIDDYFQRLTGHLSQPVAALPPLNDTGDGGKTIAEPDLLPAGGDN